MAKYAKDAKKFSSLFKKALTDKEGDKKKTTMEQERDYYSLTFFINGLKKKEQIDACLDEYLKIYTKYPTEDRRSKFVFAILLKKRIEMSKDDDKYIEEISDILADNQKPYRSPIKQRYEDLEQKEKAEIDSELKYKKTLKKQRTSILDLLKKSYSKANKKEPTLKELVDYDPAPDKDLEKEYKALRDKCGVSWSKNDAENIKEGIKDFTAFLSGQKDSSKLFQILKWTRDAVIVRKQTVTTRDGGTATYTNPPADDLDRELYFQCVYWLFRYAVKHGYPKNYKGFTNEEKGFFFNPFSSAYFSQQYVNRYTAGITKASEFLDVSVLFLRLLIFARINDAELQNNDDTSRIKKILEKTPKAELRTKSFYMGVGAEVLRGNMRIGDKIGKVKIAYFDNVDVSNTSSRQIYVEFVGLENLLFKISIGRLSDYNNQNFYTTLWMNTRHLLQLIPLIFQLLGYTFSLVTGGLSALAVDIATDVIVGEYAEAANLSPGASMALSTVVGGGPSLAKGAIVKGTMSKALGRELGDLAGDEARALRQTENLMTDEARALNKTETTASNIQTSQRLNMSDNTIRNTGTGGSSQGTAGSGAGRVNQGTGGGPGGGGTSGTIPSRPPGGEPDMPEYKVAIKPEYAEELADHLVQNSVWMQEIEQIYRITNLETRYARIEAFMQNYSRGTGINIEVVPQHLAGQYGIGPKNWGTYLPDQKKILLHEGIFTKPGVNPVEQIGHEVGAAELERVLGIPKDSIPKVYDVPPPYSSLTHIVDRRIKPGD
jgi:hypothetical protein